MIVLHVAPAIGAVRLLCAPFLRANVLVIPWCAGSFNPRSKQ
jgi:hypothetical protein